MPLTTFDNFDNFAPSKDVEPRLKKEDFEKDFPPQKKANKLASLQAILATDAHGWARIKTIGRKNAHPALAYDPLVSAGRRQETEKFGRELTRILTNENSCWNWVAAGFSLRFTGETSVLLSIAIAKSFFLNGKI